MPSMRARTSACRHRRRRPAAAHVAAASAAPANSIPATALPATATAARARRHSCARVRQFGEDRDDVGADLVRLARGIDPANTLWLGFGARKAAVTDLGHESQGFMFEAVFLKTGRASCWARTCQPMVSCVVVR